ncbi:MAG TPA: hypothetical protein VNT99_08425 [Methylomirabilota bacterium]|nr:hypothetical protein [Methylomirabilota bacterium]
MGSSAANSGALIRVRSDGGAQAPGGTVLAHINFKRGPRAAPKHIRDSGEDGSVLDEGRRWQIRWHMDGKLQRKRYSKQKFTRARVEEFLRTELAKKAAGDISIATLSREVREIVRFCELHGITIRDLQLLPWMKQRGTQMEERTGQKISPVQFFEEACVAREQRHSQSCRTVPQVVESFLAEIEARSERQGSSGCHWRNLRARLNKFAAVFTGPVSSLERPLVQSWLKGLPYAAKTVNHYRAAVVEALYFAKGQGHCTRELVESIADIDPYKLIDRVATPYSVKEMRAILDYTHAHRLKHLPTIVLVAFCGVRVCEVAGEKGFLDWGDIDLDERVIHIPAKLAKKRKKRDAPVTENAYAWLKLVAKPSGAICPVDRPSEAATRILVNARVPRKKNGFRSAFISHRVDLTKDLKATAIEAGTSVGRIESNYYAIRGKGEPQAYFELRPRQLQLDLGLNSGSRS